MTSDEVERSLEEDRQAYYREMGWVNEERDRYLRPKPAPFWPDYVPERTFGDRLKAAAWAVFAVVAVPVVIFGSLLMMAVATMGWPW